MWPFIRVLLVAALCVAAVPIGPARGQVDSREGIALQNEIYELRQELRALQDQGPRGGGSRTFPNSPPPAQSGVNEIVAQLLTRLDALEDQVRQLRGRIDETQNQVQRQGADINKRIDDLAFQINPQGSSSSGSASGYPAGTPGGSGPRQSQGSSQGQPPAASPLQPAGARPPGPRTPEIALQDGNAALGRRDYTSAEAAAREVLSNRTSPRAYDAQILLAQALAGERQYAQSAIAFDDAYNRSRKGSHAQDALVGLAASLAAINEKKAACDTLVRLRTEFPQPRADIRDAAAAAGQKAGCR